MKYWILNPINCFGTSESIGKNETHPVAKRNLKLASKGIAIILIIIIAFYIGGVIYKIFLLNYLEERFKEYDTWDNYYVEIRSFEDARLTETRRIWYRDNNYKIVVDVFLEGKKNYSYTKWIDCKQYTIIESKNDGIYKKELEHRIAKEIYANGKYKNEYLYWKRLIDSDKTILLFGLNTLEVSKNEEKTKIRIENNVIEFEKNSILPKIYISQTNNKLYYQYYYVKLNSVNENDLKYKEDLQE